MSQFKVEVYKSSRKEEWDDFVEKSQEATFLFFRDFMEYHADRFDDFSLLVYSENSLIGILPANIKDNKVYSHNGLTYGGLLVESGVHEAIITAVFQSVLKFLKQHGIASLALKMLPEFYQQKNSEIIEHYVTSIHAKITETLNVLGIDYSQPLAIHKTKRKHYRKNHNKGFVIEHDDNFTLFWDKVLCPRLAEKHNTKPVHSLEEILYLKSKFPQYIKQYNIYLEGKILAGITMFEKGDIVKSQYGATTEKGQAERALEYLFIHLIDKYKSEDKSYFSMGTVVDKSYPLGYNDGLLKQKKELGCTAYSQKFFNLSLI